MRVTLEFISGPAKAPRIWVSDGRELTVGRTEAADVALPGDGEVSGQHFNLSIKDGHCHLTDLNSRNGTFVNESRISSAVLKMGDNVRVGRTVFEVKLEQGIRDSAILTPPPQPASGLPADAIDLRDTLPSSTTQKKLPQRPEPVPPRSQPIAEPQQVPRKQPLPATDQAVRGGVAKGRIIRLAIEITTGPLKGERRWLRTGQSLSVGRSDHSDFAIGQDDRLSRRHFEIELSSDGYLVRDLGSTSGTTVNGDPASDLKLRRDADIQAGMTRFRITLEAEAAQEERGAAGPGFTVRVLASQLAEFHGELKSGSLAHVAEKLRAAFDIHMVVNPYTCELRLPLAVPALLDWVDGRNTRHLSPVLVEPKLDELQKEIIEQGNVDAFVCVLSTKGQTEVAAHLRALSRGQSRKTEVAAPERFLGYWSPHRLRAVLRQATPDYVSFAFSKAEAILMVSDAQHWQVFALPSFSDSLEELGLGVAELIDAGDPLSD